MRRAGYIWLWIAGLVASVSTVQAQSGGMRLDSGRGCAVCHLQWVEAFQSGGDDLLMAGPLHPVVSESESCLGCHDGSVADDRRSVWLEHGHESGTPIPSDMRVPDDLPVDDNKLSCRTCHTAHRGGTETLAEVFVLRKPVAQLCVSCHRGYADPEHGGHPLVEMDQPLPESVLAGQVNGDHHQRQMTCRTCHRPHGTGQPQLLVVSPQDNALCADCHARVHPQMFAGDEHQLHNWTAPMSDEQAEAVRQMKGRVGPEQTLMCLSCHRVHRGQPDEHLLAVTREDGQFCARCHPEQQTVGGSGHDLQFVNKHAETPYECSRADEGACGACHGAHLQARQPRPTDDDPQGWCRTCHDQGQCAERATFASNDHPNIIDKDMLPDDVSLTLFDVEGQSHKKRLGCQSCHQVHDPSHGFFLRQRQDDLCGQCHQQQSGGLHGAHDLTDHPKIRNRAGQSAEQVGRCGVCHTVHDAQGPVLWAGQPVQSHGQLCRACHPAEHDGAGGSSYSLRHPTGTATADRLREMHADLPLFNKQLHQDDGGFMTCATCHKTHGDSSVGIDLLRGDNADMPGLCLSCHEQMCSVAGSLHRESSLEDWSALHDGRQVTEFCGPCHVTHARPAMQAEGMWAAPLGPADQPLAARQCLGCHSESGGATQVRFVEHPPVVMVNPVAAGKPGYMPLVDDDGRLADSGQLTCQSCHTPHGRTFGDAPCTQPTDASAVQLRAGGVMNRGYQTPNLCSSCHGQEGRLLYLYWHYPEKRPRAGGMSPREWMEQE